MRLEIFGAGLVKAFLCKFPGLFLEIVLALGRLLLLNGFGLGLGVFRDGCRILGLAAALLGCGSLVCRLGFSDRRRLCCRGLSLSLGGILLFGCGIPGLAAGFSLGYLEACCAGA